MSSCPKCGAESGGTWDQCEGLCPMPMSPHYRVLINTRELPYYELHITLENAEHLRESTLYIKFGNDMWKFSEILRDPILGNDPKQYLTLHLPKHHGYERCEESLGNAINDLIGKKFDVIRGKIEVVTYDKLIKKAKD